MARRNPCLDHGCSACCINTRMTLTGADLDQLEAAGREGFFFFNREGVPQLRNEDGHCVFLVDGRCTVYHQRPEGCRLYPLILDLDEVVRDDFCPWRDEFEFAAGDEERLRASVATEILEASRRRGGSR
jgi:Fe-S-cluster containining protein